MAAPLILLLDDEPMLRGATASMLTSRGGHVSVARHLNEAVELARERPHEVAIIDLAATPPLEVIAALRPHLGAACHFIVCVGPDHSPELDGVDVLSKPFDFEHLLDLVFSRPARRKRSRSGVFPLFGAPAQQGRLWRGKPS